MNLSNRTDSIELLNDYATSETDLFGEPVKTAEQVETERRQAIIEFVETAWSKLCDDTPAIRRLTTNKLDDARAEKAIAVARKFIGDRDEIAVWTEIIRQIRSSHWLCGEKPPRDDRPPFKLQMTWLLENRNFTKVVEGKFEDGRNPDVASGGGLTRHSPASQVAARVLGRIGARRSRGSGPGNRGISQTG